MSFQEQIIGLLQTTILGILNIGAGYLVYYISQLSQKAKIKNEATKDEKQKVLIDNAIDRLDTLVSKSVIATNETLGKAIREGLSDGKTSKEELLALKDIVIKDVNSQLSQEVKDILSNQIDDLNSYISNSIEITLKGLKDIESK